MLNKPGRLIAVLLVGLTLRLGVALWVNSANPAALMQPDSHGYDRLALNLLNHGVFSRSPGPPFEFEVFRVPGYPTFLALVYFLFSPAPLPAVLIQSLFAVLTALLAFAIARRLFSPETGVLAALLVGLDMASIAYACTLMSEVLFGLLLALGVCLLLRTWRSWRFRSLSAPKPGWPEALAGLSLGLATFVRPLGYYLVPLLGLALLFRHVFGRNLRAGVVRAGLFLLTPALLFGAWQGYRFCRTGSARFSQVECLNMLWYRGCGALSLATRQPIHELQTAMGLDARTGRFDRWFDLHPEMRGLDNTRLSELWLRAGWRLALKYPGQLALVHLRGLFVQLFDPGSFALAQMAGAEDSESGHAIHAVLQRSPFSLLRFLWREHRLLLVFSVAGVLWLALVYAGTIAAFVGRRPGFAALPLLVVVAYCLLVASGCEASARFRVPVFPFVAVLAAQGWRRIFRRCS